MKTRYHRTLAHFLDRPRDATYYGYQPSYLDCISFTARLMSWKNVKNIPSMFYDLLDAEVREFPLQLIMTLLSVVSLILIPLGGFFIMGSAAYFIKYRPKVLQARMKHIDDRDGFGVTFRGEAR